MPEHRDRHFGGKVQCFNAGFERLRGMDFDIIGNLDADITFGEDQFEFLPGEFAADSRLGVAGTPFVEENAPTTSASLPWTTSPVPASSSGTSATKGSGVTTGERRRHRLDCRHHRPHARLADPDLSGSCLPSPPPDGNP